VLQTGIQLRAYVPVAASAPPRTLWKYLVPMMIGLVLWFIPPPSGLPLKAWHMFAVFVTMFGRGVVGQPAREAMIGLPAKAFELMDLVYSTGKPGVPQLLEATGPGQYKARGYTLSFDDNAMGFTLAIPRVSLHFTRLP